MTGGYFACVYCGNEVLEEAGFESACCGEVNHTEWISEFTDSKPLDGSCT